MAVFLSGKKNFRLAIETGKAAATSYTYNALNQLESFTESGTHTVSYTYDLNGNRATRVDGSNTDTYTWDFENRLSGLTKQSTGGTGTYGWAYDYRTRRVELAYNSTVTKDVFSGGTEVREFENTLPTVDYVRGSDWGGGVGGILYTARSAVPSFNHYDRRGDVTTKTDLSGVVTYQATYEAFGKRVTETGSTLDRQKSNTKDEDMPGYANEGFRFRDLETGCFISRDPAGFVDGPNLYTYVKQNPWTSFDPEGLSELAMGAGLGAGLLAAGEYAVGAVVAVVSLPEVLIAGGVAVVVVGGYEVYQNWPSSGAPTAQTSPPGGESSSATNNQSQEEAKPEAPAEPPPAAEPAPEAQPEPQTAPAEPQTAPAEPQQPTPDESPKPPLGPVPSKEEDGSSQKKKIPKPGKGKGTVPPSQRDKKRVFPKSEKEKHLKQNGGACDGCEKPLPIDKSKGHHVERHADGGQTVPGNLAVVCPDCHEKLHK